jgi:hypothetical protein
MAPIVEALILCESFEENPVVADDPQFIAGSWYTIKNIFPPRIALPRFPSEPLHTCLFTRLREIQSEEDARAIDVVGTVGLVGEEWFREPLFQGPLAGVTPAHAVSATGTFPRGKIREPCIMVYKLEYKGKEIARTMLEVVEGELGP